MRRYLTSFGGQVKGFNRHMSSFGITRDYTREVVRLFESGKPFFDEFITHDGDWLLQSEYASTESAKKVMAEDSYGWCIKAVMIKECLSQMEENDLLMWVDSNHVFVAHPQALFDLTMSNGLYCHEHWGVVYPNIDWTTKRMLINTDCDKPEFLYAPQMQVNITAYRKLPWVVDFVDEWLGYALDYDTMITNDLPNYPSFKEHRHEQSLFSLLRVKYGVPYYANPYQIIHELNGIDINE